MKPSVLITILLISVIMAHSQVLFNPATYPTNSLPTGMTIVTIDNEKFLQVALNNWDNLLQVSATSLNHVDNFYAKIGYKNGSSGLNNSQIVEIVQLIDTTALIYQKAAEISRHASHEVKYHFADIFYRENTVHQIRFVARNTTTWEAVSGDTLLIGLIELLPNGNVVFDPAKLDPSTLPQGMELVTIDNAPMLKVVTKGWNQHLNIPVTLPDSINYLKTTLKYEQGSSGCIAQNAQVFVNIGFDTVTYYNFQVSSPAEGAHEFYTDYYTEEYPLNSLQFAVLNTMQNWEPVDSAIIYIGKIEGFYEPPVCSPYIPIITNRTTLNYQTGEAIIDGQKDDLYSAERPINRIAWGQANHLPDGAMVTTQPNNDTYAQWYGAFNNDNLYLYINVADDTVVTPANSLTHADELEIVIAYHKNGIYGEDFYSSYNFTVKPGEWKVLTAGNGLSEKSDAEVTYASMITEQGYTVEITIPFALLKWHYAYPLKNAHNPYCKKSDFETYYFLSLDFRLVDHDGGNQIKSVLCWGNNTGFDVINANTYNYRGEVKLLGIPSSVMQPQTMGWQPEVFPNPFSNTLTINSSTPVAEVFVYNLTGQLLFKQAITPANTLNLSFPEFKHGLYMLEIVTINGQIWRGKVLKE